MIYHYTTTASLDGIIRNDGIYLRATHYQHLNDKNEVAWCQESLRDLCEDLKNMPDEEFQLYYNTPYIISFCGLHDDLNMWRLYGDNGKGIMFCFDYKMMKEISKLTQLCLSSDDSFCLSVICRFSFVALGTTNFFQSLSF